jgi:hypothetical protein
MLGGLFVMCKNKKYVHALNIHGNFFMKIVKNVASVPIRL